MENVGKTTNISWANYTWNPWQGCTKVSPGCKFCYMYRDKRRYGQNPSKVIKSSNKTFNSPLLWTNPGRVFVCSWSDFFHRNAEPWRGEAIEIIKNTPHLTYLILTKRPEVVLPWFETAVYPSGEKIEQFPDNVWFGVSAENQEYFDLRLPLLVNVPAKIKFISAEPLVGSIDMNTMLDSGYSASDIDWVISGGESGTGKDWRPAGLDWFRRIRDFCLEYGISYYHKQHGGNVKIDGEWGGRMLDGVIWEEFPDK